MASGPVLARLVPMYMTRVSLALAAVLGLATGGGFLPDAVAATAVAAEVI